MNHRGRYILDPDGNPVAEPDLIKWGMWLESPEHRQVAHDDIAGACVSTVFLGLDFDYFRAGPPLLWETLVFGGPLDGEGDRYATFEDAVHGHGTMVARVLTHP